MAVMRDVSERERLLAEVEAHRARLSAVIGQAPEAIVIADGEGRIVSANAAAERLYVRPIPYGEGYESHAALELCRPDGSAYPPRELPLTRSALDGAELHDVEMVIIWPNGQWRDLLVNTGPVRDGAGRVMGAVGVFQDVTEAKRSRDALRRYADRLRVLREADRAVREARSAHEIATGVLAHVRWLIPSRRASVMEFDDDAGLVSLLAVSADGDTSLAVSECCPLEWVWYLDALRAGEPYFAEDLGAVEACSPLLERLRQEGLRSYASMPLQVGEQVIGSLDVGMRMPGGLSFEESEVLQEIASHVAIGIYQACMRERLAQYTGELERQVAQRTAALRASQARLRAIFDGAALGIALVDGQGLVVEHNRALGEMLGYSDRELEGAAWDSLSVPEDHSEEQALTDELRAGARDYYQVERRYLRADGTAMWADVTVSLVEPERGTAAYVLYLLEDVTEWRQAQEVLIQSERMAVAGRLAASLSHEINNPLQSVVGCLGLAKEALAEGGEVGRFLDVALDELRRAARIVAQLRDVQRRARPEERSPVDMYALLERVLALVHQQSQDQNVEVVLERKGELRSLTVAEERIEQVFLHLVLNALDAMPEGGRLVLTAEGTAGPAGLRVTVRDTGLGMPPEVLANLFNPFYTTKEEGLGLGLFVSRDILMQHGGSIDVESAPGEGTTFTVWLPA